LAPLVFVEQYTQEPVRNASGMAGKTQVKNGDGCHSEGILFLSSIVLDRNKILSE
jgi:hypothetical protein